MHTLLLTCAGKSTRFPNYRPKWSVTHPSGNLIAAEAIRGLSGYDRIVAAMRQEHVDEYGADKIALEFNLAGFDVEVVVVPDTPTQVDTVVEALAHIDGSFTVKDCDNYFELELAPENSVALVPLAAAGKVNAANKSYAIVTGGEITKLREKKIISDSFCCGAYSFASVEVFRAGIENAGYRAAFLSEVMDNIVGGPEVLPRYAEAYVDWGTEEDWQDYCRTFKTLFVDIDGVLCLASHRTFSPSWGETESITENVEYLRQMQATGRVELILTTARRESARETTELQLERLGLSYSRLLMGLRNCSRVLVNDAVGKRGERTAFAINVERNSPTLGHKLRSDP